MCYGCWTEEGMPQIDTPTVRAAALAVAEVYQHSCVGGNLHIVLDDWNLEDDSLEFCAKQIAAGGYKRSETHSKVLGVRDDDSPEKLAAEQRCHDLFAALTMKERASALALNDGFWNLASSSPTPAPQKTKP